MYLALVGQGVRRPKLLQLLAPGYQQATQLVEQPTPLLGQLFLPHPFRLVQQSTSFGRAVCFVEAQSYVGLGHSIIAWVHFFLSLSEIQAWPGKQVAKADWWAFCQRYMYYSAALGTCHPQSWGLGEGMLGKRGDSNSEFGQRDQSFRQLLAKNEARSAGKGLFWPR